MLGILAYSSAHTKLMLLAGAGCRACIVQPDVDTAFGIVHALSPSVVRKSLQGLREAGEQVRAVLITSPTYFGEVSDVATLAEVLLATILALAKNPHHRFAPRIASLWFILWAVKSMKIAWHMSCFYLWQFTIGEQENTPYSSAGKCPFTLL
jgi:hypothetical protein